MALGMFSSSILGMDAQSHALQTVAQNLANMNTIGYKSSNTMFHSLIGSTSSVRGNNSGLASSKSDVGGIGYYDRTNVDMQGVVTASNGKYDVAINGTGNAFFMSKDPSGEMFYSRAGNFNTRTEDGTTYLVNNAGLKMQGYAAMPNDGGFSSSLSDLTITYPNKIPSVPSSKIEVSANVPANGVETSSYGVNVYGPNNDGKTMNMLFTKTEGMVNTWDISFNVEGGTVSSAEPIQATFDSSGNLVTPKDMNVTVNWEDGSSNNIAMDISHMTQLDGSSGITHVSQNGRPGGDFLDSFIDKNGVLTAVYSNEATIAMGKIALAQFPAPNNLIPVSGTLFQASRDSGDHSLIEKSDNYIASQALEQSNVKVEEEFSRLVVVQRAYNLNSQSFTVGNEMMQTAINIKS